jgi:ABC-2 type transport system ATP-binding protein
MEITAKGAGLTKITVRTKNAVLKNSKKKFAAVEQINHKEDYVIYFSTNIGRSVAEIIKQIELKKDILIDLRVERPSLEDRFLEITTNGDNK